eukprot:scaffold9859_cov122-Isochrysis_galbana.AAC.1
MVVGAWWCLEPCGSSEQWAVSVPKGFCPEKGGVENTTAGCNGGRCMVVPCESIEEWAVRAWMLCYHVTMTLFS